MANPVKYYSNNTSVSLGLIKVAVSQNVKRLIFSSTAAVYGSVGLEPVLEDAPKAPLSPYGTSKLMTEWMLRDISAASSLQFGAFRYFNVAGADPEGEVGEFHQPETHLVPLILDAIDGKRAALTIFGTDYDTPDGTCIRDYVHVCDLVDAHILGLKWLQSGKGGRVFNLGTGTGFSVREVMDHAAEVTGKPVPCTEGPRRAGDCTKLVSGSKRAEEELGWTPQRSTLKQMVADAWNWHQTGHYDK